MSREQSLRSGAGLMVLAVIMQRFERFSLLPTAFA